ncbi:hypothetical protein FHR36_007223 [Kitasatospora paracochleata]|uniref:Uncharacterized protein n=1 Tax=Kitasatospora paracochleata TaxID=58354 RepID=A0ABT1JA91_9ACTN|nr:hypothetical protein [Kitasatospora paracochleata]
MGRVVGAVRHRAAGADCQGLPRRAPRLRAPAM